jgi:RHS repeat-associated protein
MATPGTCGRHYDPATGQFLNRDPLEMQTRDVYGYAGSNPLNNIEPSGTG